MDGVLIIDKPEGWTSHDVVARARRLLRVRRVGHTGTLDPFATGVLVLVVGRATRLVQFLSVAEKEYEATVRLGYATDTGDLTGTRLGEIEPCPAHHRDEIESALQNLRGEIDQVPPRYSAKKVQGRKLYELARQGIEVERKAVKVAIHELEFGHASSETMFFNEDGTCDLPLRVVCSAGTYVRALAESIGEALGTSAHLSALRRTRAGCFRIDDAVTLDQLEAMVTPEENEKLLSMDTALSHLPAAHLTDEAARRVRHGAAVGARDLSRELTNGALVRLRDGDKNLLAVAVYDAALELFRPRVTLADASNKP